MLSGLARTPARRLGCGLARTAIAARRSRAWPLTSLFALATLAAPAQLPDWGQYLAYLNEFLFGQVGDITYDFPRWSPGLAVGAGYAGLGGSPSPSWRAARELVDRERPALIALAGTTAYGIVLFSYFVDRSRTTSCPTSRFRR